MVTMDLQAVNWGQKRIEKEARAFEEAVLKLSEQGIRDKAGNVIKSFTKEEAAERLKHLKFIPVEHAKTVLIQQVNNYFEIKYREKKDGKPVQDGALVAPLEERRRGGKVIRRIEDADDVVEFGDEDFEWLVKTFEGESAMHVDIMTVYEVVNGLWAERVVEKKNSGE